jgi:hypothetical protein
MPQSDMPVPDRPIPNPAAVQEEGTDGWTLLVNPDTAGAMAVNHTGVLIWRPANGRRTIGGIAEVVRLMPLRSRLLWPTRSESVPQERYFTEPA